MDTPDMKRREFFTGVVRACLLGGLTLVGGVLVWRCRKAGACVDTRACSACRVYAACPIRQQRDEAKP
ncbi:MAG TPA: hypothetical protein PK166_03120 [Candidatus Hydrogenedentes bacterium]|nr:hypothetical protein [Candidatus Hydrogenedentota bacterium]HQE82633.1 hypothetical protein [Candidatus Hydrogenedentota bacterium]HQH67358.1 hypothetical protein [Candidatus Hydrogenedentota bacterium]HQM48412.1 hypothetical protein [Candidatus Hydrogenedentota bacterium]